MQDSSFSQLADPPAHFCGAVEMLSRFSVCSVARALKIGGGGEPQKEPPGPATVTAPLQTAAAQPQQVVTVVKVKVKGCPPLQMPIHSLRSFLHIANVCVRPP